MISATLTTTFYNPHTVGKAQIADHQGWRRSVCAVDAGCRRTFPDIGPQSISDAVEIPLDVSTQTLRNSETVFADLEAAGGIQR
jgi:hypothetical protein